MATATGDLGRDRKRPPFARPLLLRRGERDQALQKGRRRVLRARHVLALLALQAALFAGLREAYLFLITWDHLTIRKVEVVCAKDGLRRALEAGFASPRLGNILLCDLAALRAGLLRLAWVRDASLEKVFPATVRITVVPRTPFALLERGGLWLADEEGRVLEPAGPADCESLPVVADEGGFAAGFFDKWAAAVRCLRSLPAAERARLAGVRTGDGGALALAFRDDPVVVVVGRRAPAEDLARFRDRRAAWEGFGGPLAVVDMSFDGRVFLTAAAPPPAGDAGPRPGPVQGE
ncbi:MAG TPA: FtsQ-type POTRA domain-containing protein [Candidatus Aminicenantes bacterium]|nr:FtsQ-type POTRA domain-containing protein [Candidatus Aminicenantes bacterium]